MSMPPTVYPPFPHSQRGAASVAIAFLVLLVIAAALATALSLSGSVVRDAAMSEEQAEALFLAESGIERTAQRLSGTACASLGTEGPFTLGSGSFSVVAPAPYIDTGLCRVRVSGTVRQVTRTVDAWLSSGGGTITVDSSGSSNAITTSLSFAHTVGTTAGVTANILLVGVSADNANAAPIVKYNNLTLTQLIQAGNGVGNPGAWIYYLLNPTAGNHNVVVALSNQDVVAGSVSFYGVSTSNPFDVAAVAAIQNNSTSISRPITSATAGAWVFEVVASEGGKAISPNPLQGIQAVRWNLRQNSVTGAASTLGAVSSAGTTVTPAWKTDGNDTVKWAQAAAALRPGGGGGSPQLMRWSEVVN